jgi:hypothetical protein
MLSKTRTEINPQKWHKFEEKKTRQKLTQFDIPLQHAEENEWTPPKKLISSEWKMTHWWFFLLMIAYVKKITMQAHVLRVK